MTAAVTRTAGRPRDPGLDRAILAAAEQQLRELGYARMSLESVAAAAGTTVPTVRRRFSGKAALAAAVIGSRGHAPWRSCGISTTTCGGRTRWRSSARCWPKRGAIPNC